MIVLDYFIAALIIRFLVLKSIKIVNENILRKSNVFAFAGKKTLNKEYSYTKEYIEKILSDPDLQKSFNNEDIDKFINNPHIKKDEKEHLIKLKNQLNERHVVKNEIDMKKTKQLLDKEQPVTII
jgi:hypothetical protein